MKVAIIIELIVGRMKLTISIKRAVLKYNAQRMSARQIAKGYNMTFMCLVKLLASFLHNITKVRKPGSGRPSKITDAVLRAVEAKMQSDDATTT